MRKLKSSKAEKLKAKAIKLTSWQIDRLPHWQDDKRTERKYVKMTIWQDDRMIRWKENRMTKVAKCYQKLSKMARSPEVSKSCQTLLKVAKMCQKLPTGIKSCQKKAKCCNKFSKIVKSFQLLAHWNSIIIHSNLPLSNYGRPLQPELPPTHMTHIPSKIVKMTTDFVEIASLSSVTYHCQIMVVHCSLNCHLLVWPIYQAQWSKWQQIWLK